MDGLNRVMLLGNLGADPELRMTSTGQAVLNVRLATTESYLDKNRARQERTEWHTVIVWGKRAEGLGKILRKGDRILVEGGLRTSSYDDRDGNKRYKTEVVATNVILSGSKTGARPAPIDDAESSGGLGSFVAGPGDDDIPF
jgi:single-strand DNA-binding protein